MVETMFKLAGLLDAAVYSERLKKYDSVQDWEKRTKAWREKHEVAKALAGKAYSRKKLKILLLVAASGLLGWCLAYWNG